MAMATLEAASSGHMATLNPQEWVQLPGVATMLKWDGSYPVTVYRRSDGFWDLTHLTMPGHVMLWACLADRPELGVWPIVPLTARVTYHSRQNQ